MVAGARREPSAASECCLLRNAGNPAESAHGGVMAPRAGSATVVRVPLPPDGKREWSWSRHGSTANWARAGGVMSALRHDATRTQRRLVNGVFTGLSEQG